MRVSFNAGHDHAIIGRQTTTDDGHNHAIEVGSNWTTFNAAQGRVKHRHRIIGKTTTGEKPRTGPRPPKY